MPSSVCMRLTLELLNELTWCPSPSRHPRQPSWRAEGAMFELARLHDTVHIQPADFAKNLLAAVTDFLNEKYPNKVCVCVCVHALQQ